MLLAAIATTAPTWPAGSVYETQDDQPTKAMPGKILGGLLAATRAPLLPPVKGTGFNASFTSAVALASPSELPMGVLAGTLNNNKAAEASTEKLGASSPT